MPCTPEGLHVKSSEHHQALVIERPFATYPNINRRRYALMGLLSPVVTRIGMSVSL